MITVGVDLAAEPSNTAIAELEWSGRGAVVRDLRLGATDEDVLVAVRAAEKAGIDCPFGWPTPFVAFLAEHETGHAVAPEDIAGRDWRRTLAYRETDLAVQKVTGKWPLSVSTDKICHPAMRCASLLGTLAAEGRSVDRCGSGAVVEVYPAASLKMWGLRDNGYKGSKNVEQLSQLVNSLRAEAEWLSLGSHEAACRRSDDAFDAVIAALAARAAWLKLTSQPTEEQRRRARTEGWIALPTCGLADLVSLGDHARK